jgi:pimeloyl-ACP methyl ester carboxylesterase
MGEGMSCVTAKTYALNNNIRGRPRGRADRRSDSVPCGADNRAMEEDPTVGSFAAAHLGLQHLRALLPMRLSQSLATLGGGGRTALLGELKQGGVTKLQERQAIANALGKVARNGLAAAIDELKPLTTTSGPQQPPSFLPASVSLSAPPRTTASTPDPSTNGLRVLFLHGFGLSPDLVESIGGLQGLRKALPGARVEALAGFETLDLAHGPTSAAFTFPGNGLSTIRDYQLATGEPLFGWANFLPPTEPPDPHCPPGCGYSREDTSTMSSVTEQLLDHALDGGYDLVVGFSQGGEYALLMASRLAQRAERAAGRGGMKMPTRFLLLGAECDVILDRFENPSDGSAPLAFSPDIDLSVFLVAGQEDEKAAAGGRVWSERLRAAGLRRVSAAVWAGDHRMPPSGEPVYDTALRFLGLGS